MGEHYSPARQCLEQRAESTWQELEWARRRKPFRDWVAIIWYLAKVREQVFFGYLSSVKAAPNDVATRSPQLPSGNDGRLHDVAP